MKTKILMLILFSTLSLQLRSMEYVKMYEGIDQVKRNKLTNQYSNLEIHGLYYEMKKYNKTRPSLIPNYNNFPKEECNLLIVLNYLLLEKLKQVIYLAMKNSKNSNIAADDLNSTINGLINSLCTHYKLDIDLEKFMELVESVDSMDTK